MRDWNDPMSGGPDPGTVPDRDRLRPVWAEIDAAALRHNAALLRAVVAPSSLCAVVKADGYGHGAVTAARAAVAGGAVGVAVALVEEAAQLRDAQFAEPTLLLAEPPPGSELQVVELGIEPTVATAGSVERLADAARRVGKRVSVHIKVDTGMHRTGASPEDVGELAELVTAASPSLMLAGFWTHLAVAEGEHLADQEFTLHQLGSFDKARRQLARRGIEPRVLHAANSAAAIAVPESRFHMVRCGISLYGYSPSPVVSDALMRQAPNDGLHPALSLKARVASVRDLPAGARPSYGRHRPLPTGATVATVPLGYADGMPRQLFQAGCELLLHGKRRPLAGMVTMDHVMVDCEDDRDVAVGDEVVLLGRQGSEVITADEWATRLGTISYEILTTIGARVPRMVMGWEGRNDSAESAEDRTAGTESAGGAGTAGSDGQGQSGERRPAAESDSANRFSRWVQEARLR